jgi:predicted nucleic acid-binding protein
VAGLVLSDASPFIGLSIVGGLAWLEELFGTVWVPPEVNDEVLGGPVARGQDAIQAGLAAGWLGVWQGPRSEAPLPALDEGEAACIGIALAHPQPSLLLIDERAGRAMATEHGVRVAGTAAVIGLARQRGLIPAARPVFATSHASDFRISAEVIRVVLARVGES